MKLDSKYFDKIRVKPGEERLARGRVPPCEWPGCTKPGRHKAPKGRGQEGQFHNYCTEHVQHYNKTYNYFAGMKDDAVADFQKDARTGHRPDLEARRQCLGDPQWRQEAAERPLPLQRGFRDPFGVTGEDGQPNTDRRAGVSCAMPS